MQSGTKEPFHPRTEFGNTLQSLLCQSVNPFYSRDKESSRNVLAKERVKTSEQIVKRKKIQSNCGNHKKLCKFSDEIVRPGIDFLIQIHNR